MKLVKEHLKQSLFSYQDQLRRNNGYIEEYRLSLDKLEKANNDTLKNIKQYEDAIQKLELPSLYTSKMVLRNKDE